MAIVTYILLTALHSGIHERFHPQVCTCASRPQWYQVLMLPLQILGESASRATAVIFLDFCFFKLGCYILNIQGSSQVIDIIAYGGYKFVGYIHLINDRIGVWPYPWFQCDSIVRSRFPGCNWISLDSNICICFFFECVFPGSSIFYVCPSLFFFLTFCGTASISSLCCSPWDVQRTTYSRNFKNQFSSTSASYHLFVHRGRHADPLYGMVGEDISGMKKKLDIFCFYITSSSYL